MNDQGNLLRQLRVADFCLQDAAIYRDAYPDSAEAAAYYKECQEDWQKLYHEYIQKVGPLSIYSNLSDSWKWVESAWPWESEAN